MQRVHALRGIFPRCRFHEERTEAGLATLALYHERWDEERGIGLGPEHDKTSHCADAAGLAAVYASQAMNAGQAKLPPLKRNLRGIA
jgi:phage terminase large subunit